MQVTGKPVLPVKLFFQQQYIYRKKVRFPPHVTRFNCTQLHYKRMKFSYGTIPFLKNPFNEFLIHFFLPMISRQINYFYFILHKCNKNFLIIRNFNYEKTNMHNLLSFGKIGNPHSVRNVTNNISGHFYLFFSKNWIMGKHTTAVVRKNSKDVKYVY